MYVRGYLQGSENGRVVTIVRNWQPSRKKCFYRYDTKGFRATKFRNLLELTVELLRNF